MMAENLATPAERERVAGTNLNDRLRVDPALSPSGIGVYDRPETTRPAANNRFGTIIGILLILILAYFVFQWLF